MTPKSIDRLHLGRTKSEAIFPAAPVASNLPESYAQLLGSLKTRIRQERMRVVLSSNAALVNLYWNIGKSILKKQDEDGWGSKVIDRLSADLSKEFSDMKGFSPRNLKYMRAFASAWPKKIIVQEVLAQMCSRRPIRAHPTGRLHYDRMSLKRVLKRAKVNALRSLLSWTHYRLLLKIENIEARGFYEAESIKSRWSSRELDRQINSLLFERLTLSKDKKQVLKMAKEGQAVDEPEDLLFFYCPALDKIYS